MKFIELFKNMIFDSAKKGLKNSTISIYEGYLRNYIKPQLGEIDVKDLSIAKLQNFYDEIINNTKISIKTLRNIHSVINRCLKRAVKEGLILINPSDYIELPKEQKKEIEILTDEEISKLIVIVEKERYGISIEIALNTGLRLGEILGLKWCDVDLDRRILVVKHSLNREIVKENNLNKKTELILHEPKTENSKREVPLKKELIEKLIDFKQQQQCRYKDKDIQEDFVLSNKYKKPIDPRTIQEFFKRMQIKAGIGHYKFHALRHTFASKAIRTGISDKVTSKILGHSNVSTTLNIYAHISDDMVKDIVDKI